MLVWRERLTHHGRAGGHSLPPLQVRTAGRCPTIRVILALRYLALNRTPIRMQSPKLKNRGGVMHE